MRIASFRLLRVIGQTGAPLKTHQAMMNIFIRNLDLDATEDQLRALFETHGAVESVTIVKDRDTGQSRGFAFVEMTKDEEAHAAISAVNGTVLHKQPMRVNEARPKLIRDQNDVSTATRDHRHHQI
jgi:cold-inducible RNA-binding protein